MKYKNHLEILHADCTLNPSRIFGLLDLDLTAPLVVAERAVEEGLHGLNVLSLGAGTSLGFSTAHLTAEKIKNTKR